MRIQRKSNLINAQQRQKQQTVYQKLLQPLMSLELESLVHEQFNTTPRPVPLMSLSHCYYSPSSKSSNGPIRFHGYKHAHNHINHNSKYYHPIKRRAYQRRCRTHKPNIKPIKNIPTYTTTMVQNKIKSKEDKTTSVNNTYPLEIYMLVHTEGIELS